MLIVLLGVVVGDVHPTAIPLDRTALLTIVCRIGFAFSVLTCWTALAGSLTVAISAGGPPVIIYSWIAV